MRPALVTFLLLVAALLVGEAAAPPRDDGQWTMPGKDFAATRYSGLTEITPANVARLRPQWSFSTGVLGGHEGQPLVVNNTMYVVTPFPNVLYAFDLTREGYPLKRKYRPDVNPTSVGIARGDALNRAGVPMWRWLSYDPDLDLLYYGTGNAAPYNPEQRPGDNKWASSVLARRPEDGSLVWAYQFTPHENWDFDANAEMILADVTVQGRRRRVLVHFDKNGFAYTIDRATGEVLVAAPFTPVTWAQRIDLATGRPVVDTAKVTGASRGNIKDICPSLEGGKSPVSAASYSPRTGLFYVSTNNLCMDYQATQVTRIAGTPYIGASTPYHAGPGGHMGAFIAWDASVGRRVWEVREPYPDVDRSV